MRTFDEVQQAIFRFRDERAWKQFHTPRQLAAAIAIESAELQETMLWKTDEEVDRFLADGHGKGEVQSEVADVLIFLLAFCDEVGIDPLDAIDGKLRENEEKYPIELAKGSRAKYTELKGRKADR